ncbi:MAG: translocation/assembly module TamB domain-containing protein, partial [Bacteroidales bacterium]|nr:translocation/assembly module TamB domain-containing protein [Bacteroidales bacterium]
TAITVRYTVDPKRPIIIDGGLRTKDLDIGKIAGIDALGPITLGTTLEASLPEKGGINVRIDSLRIDRLNALGYDYTNISAAGNYAEDAFDGRIIAADPNLSFLFQGKFNLSKKTKNQVYRFYASLGYADLHALKIDKRPQSKISFQATSNFLRTESHDILGDVNIRDLTLVSATGIHNLGSLSVKAHANDNVHRINLSSSFLEGTYLGDKAFFDFVNHLRSLTIDRDLSALTPNPAPAWDGSTYSVNLKVKGAHDLLDFLAPGAYAANPTELSLGIDRDGILKGSLKSDRIALKEKFIRNLDLSFSNEREVLKADLSSSSIQLSSGVKLLGSRLALFANDNHVGLGYSFDNSEEDASKAELYLSADLDRDRDGLSVTARALPSNLYYNGAGWGISSGDIRYKGGDLSVDRLRAIHDDELLEVDGAYSSSRTDTLSVRMEKFDVGIVSTFIGNLLPIEGYASGNAVVISPGSPIPGIEASIVCDSTNVSGQCLGTLALASNWDASAGRFNLGVHNMLDGASTIDLDGYFVPDNQTLVADALLRRFNIAVASPILSTVFSTFDGFLDGALHVNGPVSNIALSSRDLKLSDGHIALDFTRALYDIEGDLSVTQDVIGLTELRLRDNAGGTGTVKGDVIINRFRDIGTDLAVKLDRLKALDLRRGENSTLYGSLPVSGSVNVKGPLSRIVVDINATTSGPGDLHLPIGGASGEIERKMLVFTQPPDDLQQDPYELMMAAGAKQKQEETNLVINLSARATPDATVYIDLGENTLHARGNGTIGLNMETAQNIFGLSGDYTLQEGSFRFSAMNLVSRDFTIQDGSSVRFNGPVNDTDLSVKGLYVTKASLDNLMTSSETESSGGSGRRTVNCGIDITGKLSNPEVQFSIDVPDLNPSTRMALDNALSTEDKIQKQFIYLLIAGSFLPDEDSGITSTGSEMLYSNISSIMSGQINNIFDKLNIPLDLGLNYKAEEGRNMFDVAVSTQLFNNRVIVNGAVGNKQMIGSSTSEITGDIDVEVKLGRSGNLRTTVFSHSADQFSTYLDNSQRNGVGITYQKEFNSFTQLFREMFMTRQQREERAARRLSGTGMTQSVIQIDSTGKSKVIDDGYNR